MIENTTTRTGFKVKAHIIKKISKIGATIGYANEEILGLDLSSTLYKGETLITWVNDTGYA